MIPTGKLKAAHDLSGKIRRFFTDGQMEELAKNYGLPHYIITNPITGETSYLFDPDEVTAWLNENCVEHQPCRIEQSLTFYRFNPDLHKVDAEDTVPKELIAIKGLYKIPLEIISSPPGVYFLCEGQEIVYVGQSLNVAQRIFTHINEGFKSFSKAYFIPCHISHLGSFESALIRYFKPKYNSTKYGSRTLKDEALFNSLCQAQEAV